MEIYKKMALILKDIEPIKKDKTNTQGAGFKYRGVDDVMNSLHEIFAKHEVFITSDTLERLEVERVSKSGNALFYVTIKVKFTFNTTDGSNVSTTVYGTAMDSGDKADNKCMSIALKYAFLQAFVIPTEEMKDPDAEKHVVQKELPELLIKDTEAMKKVIAGIQQGYTIDDVKKKYKLSTEVEKYIITQL